MLCYRSFEFWPPRLHIFVCAETVDTELPVMICWDGSSAATLDALFLALLFAVHTQGSLFNFFCFYEARIVGSYQFQTNSCILRIRIDQIKAKEGHASNKAFSKLGKKKIN